MPDYNAFLPQPGMRPPDYNPANEMPAPNDAKANLAKWQAENDQIKWAASVGGATLEYIWRTPVFDFRPELRPGDVSSSMEALAINHSAAYGTGNILQVVVAGAPAAVSGIEAEWWDTGNPIRSTAMFLLRDPQPLTDELLAGAVSSVLEGEGSTLLSFEPPGLRFWRVAIRFTIPLQALPGPDLRVWASLGV